ncbi:cupin domain-containing protein [Clostridium sp. WILCCON 0269]|uniref:Cupin domain-containing protein n=1 Tax=Candidatus Clostridium eludens TaxID=3381663 RepID=A0ABW8SWV4_9CLOT
MDCYVAYIEPHGGGPEPSHTHLHDHFFIVVEGVATIKIGEEKINVGINESIIVPGSKVYSIWNETDKLLKMIGTTIQTEK